MPFLLDFAISGTLTLQMFFHKRWSRESFHQRGPGRTPLEKAPALPNQLTRILTATDSGALSISSASRPSRDGHSSERGGSS